MVCFLVGVMLAVWGTLGVKVCVLEGTMPAVQGTHTG